MTTQNLLYYGDNLDVLKRYIKDETIDLIQNKKRMEASLQKNPHLHESLQRFSRGLGSKSSQ